MRTFESSDMLEDYDESSSNNLYVRDEDNNHCGWARGELLDIYFRG